MTRLAQLLEVEPYLLEVVRVGPAVARTLEKQLAKPLPRPALDLQWMHAMPQRPDWLPDGLTWDPTYPRGGVEQG